jgi:uncharacterized membrane protein
MSFDLFQRARGSPGAWSYERLSLLLRAHPQLSAWERWIKRPAFDVELVALTSALGALFAWGSAPLALRLPFGLLAVLFLPGYALAVALFPESRQFDPTEWLALALGLSLAVSLLIAIGLNYLPWGVRPAPIILTVTGGTWAASAVAWRRRQAIPSGTLPLAGMRGAWQGQPGPARRAMMFAGAALFIALAALAVTLLWPPVPDTEFFALGSGGLAESYPTRATVGEPISLPVGISNHEHGSQTFTIEARLGGAALAKSEPVVVAPGASWQGQISFAAPQAGDHQAVDIDLLQGDTVQRRLRLWLDVADGAGQPE